jgi:hypothetical protein
MSVESEENHKNLTITRVSAEIRTDLLPNISLESTTETLSMTPSNVIIINVSEKTVASIIRVYRGADESLAFPISYLQHNQNNFSWMR